MPRQRPLLGWLRVDRGSPVPLQEQVGMQIRAAIADGRLPRGTPLPSSRRLAAELAVARGTVAAVYDRLTGESLIQVRGRSLTFVADVLPARAPGQSAAKSPATTVGLAGDAADSNPPPYPAFMTGTPAFDIFPTTRWARLLSKRTHQMSQEFADNDFHMGGYSPLRAEIAQHLKTARGIACEPEQVVITSSARAALGTVCQVTTTRGQRCVVEDPGYVIARRILADYGLEIISLRVDANGIDIDSGVPQARLAYLTPTYQMPMGVRLADHRSRKLIEWAEREDAWIVEDDYDSEFRFAGEPIAALQGSDPDGRVIHIGTFSKTLFPSLRVAYLVLPTSLAKRASAITYLHGREPPLHVQAALFDFIALGHYGLHIHRARTVYRRRQRLLVNALNEHLKGMTEIAKPAGGMHIILPLPADIPASLVQAAAAAQALHVRPISYYAAQTTAPNALQLGYAALPDRLIEPAAAKLARIIRSFRFGPM